MDFNIQKKVSRKGFQKLQAAIAETYHNASTAKRDVVLEQYKQYTCPKPECEDKDVVRDTNEGTYVCTSCGLVLHEREAISTAYGDGVGQHCFGTVDGDRLDAMSSAKAFDGTNTSKRHKMKQKREAAEEIDGLVDDELIAKRAKLMYDRYIDSLDKVKSHARIIEACVALASNPYFHGIPKALEFKCDACNRVFNCKKNRRLHDCPKVCRIKQEQQSRTMVAA